MSPLLLLATSALLAQPRLAFVPDSGSPPSIRITDAYHNVDMVLPYDVDAMYWWFTDTANQVTGEVTATGFDPDPIPETFSLYLYGRYGVLEWYGMGHIDADLEPYRAGPDTSYMVGYLAGIVLAAFALARVLRKWFPNW